MSLSVISVHEDGSQVEEPPIVSPSCSGLNFLLNPEGLWQPSGLLTWDGYPGNLGLRRGKQSCCLLVVNVARGPGPSPIQCPAFLYQALLHRGASSSAAWLANGCMQVSGVPAVPGLEEDARVRRIW